jgi:hypothetical protein
VWHGAAVVVLAAVFLAMDLSTPPDAGANIGAGLVGLPLIAMGLPWTLPWLADPYGCDGLSELARYVWLLSAAVLNVLLHLGWASFRARRPQS